MALVQDVYYSSEFKKSYEFNYNFNVPLDVNMDVKNNDKIKFKLIDFSMINSMLNVSSNHKNNIFKVKLFNINYDITIPDGSYTPSTLRDQINSQLTALNISIAFNYDKRTNKYWLVTAPNIIAGDLFFNPYFCTSLFGFNAGWKELIYPNNYYSDTFVNMLPYTKILLCTNLAFEVNVQHNLEKKNNTNSGTGDIICWFNRDIPLFSTINYTNINNDEIELSNKNIKNINFTILNEYQEYITDCPSCFIHFQLITYDGTNWYKKFFNILNDIAYYLLSLYFNTGKPKK